MASARRKKTKGRAARFLLLALLTLLIAGFIARRTIQRLVKHDASAASANADTGGQQGLVGRGESLHPPDDKPRYAGGADSGPPIASPARNDWRSGAGKNPSGEHITGSERRQLDDLIKQKSR